MTSVVATRAALERELAEARAERDEARETLRAVLAGDVDAVVVHGPRGEQVFSREGAEHPYRVLFETMHEGAALLIGGTIAFANGRLAQITATPLDAIIGTPFVRFVCADRRAAFDALVARAPIGPGTTPLTLAAADGSLVPTQTSACALDLDGVPAVCLMVSDVSELQARSTALERSNNELEQYAYIASHDLQEPLRMITGYTKLLARRYGDRLDADGREFMEYIADGSRRMQGLITALLTYARIGLGGEVSVPTSADAVVAEAIDNLQVAIAEIGAAVEVDEPLPEAFVDRCELLQLFQNLIGNALKFRGDARPCVRVSGRSDGRVVTFAVADNGIGIKPAHQARIFALFQRLHPSDRYPGTGLGLAICKKIVQRNGGDIRVESTPGHGATFIFTLPAVAHATSHAHPPQA